MKPKVGMKFKMVDDCYSNVPKGTAVTIAKITRSGLLFFFIPGHENETLVEHENAYCLNPLFGHLEGVKYFEGDNHGK
jgi:hypothetical protein